MIVKYYIGIDDDGQVYISHAYNDHRYISKIQNGRSTRYFYTQQELQAYYNSLRGGSSSSSSSRPIGRQKTSGTSSGSSGVYRRGSGLGTGPVGNSGRPSSSSSRPIGRQKTSGTSSGSSGIYRRGSGLGTGPVGNSGRPSSSTTSSYQRLSITGGSKSNSGSRSLGDALAGRGSNIMNSGNAKTYGQIKIGKGKKAHYVSISSLTPKQLEQYAKEIEKKQEQDAAWYNGLSDGEKEIFDASGYREKRYPN